MTLSKPIPPRSTRAGASLIELLIVVAVLALLVGLAGLSVTTSRGAYDQGMIAADLEVQARRALDRIAKQLQNASASTVSVDELNPPPPGNVITWVDYRAVTGFAAGVQLGPRARLRLVPHAGELDDGIDNNGNGLVDECRLELQPDVLTAGRAVGQVGFVRRLAEGELPNGLDDNGDGLADEPGFLALWEPITAGVAGERGGRMQLQLSLERRTSAGRSVIRTVRTVVRVRSQ